MKYQFPIVAINRDGKTHTLDTLKDVEDFCNDRKNGKVGGYWYEYYFYGWEQEKRIPDLRKSYSPTSFDLFGNFTENDWILRDNAGKVVDRKQLFPPRPMYHHYNKVMAEKRAYAEKGLPIPGAGKRRCHRKSASDKGRNGTYNRDKGLKLYEDPRIERGDFDDL